MGTAEKQKELVDTAFWKQSQIMVLRQELAGKDFRKDYEQACLFVISKLEELNKELSNRLDRNIIDSMEWRVKSPESCISKLYTKGRELSLDGAVNRLNDIAGVRVVCNFLDDMYVVCGRLVKDPDFEFIKQKDYIKNPKSSGYQSLHLILRVLLPDGRKVKTEIQCRTKAMDLWSDMEHHFIYKKEGIHEDDTEQALRKCAKAIFKIDKEMMNIRRKMESR
ncbi:MAG: GTP pyrophosphokinase family protein [Lachnospiraceae bacterium]|nr:GTP pyrophosphokinase family protein [Lachnospiraceae bacterium]MDD6811199.1 GTP pyrophosphokinase family protein [Lachnospiraceae bacterium]